MKRVFSVLFFFFILVSLSSMSQSGATKLFAGAEESAINPPTGSFMAGYDQNRKSTGVHDNLFVKAVAVTNGSEAIVFVTVDCIGLPYPVVQSIRDAVEKKIPPSQLDVTHIVISSTHTHAGPDVIGIWGADQQHSGVDSGYITLLVNTAVEVITKAWKKKQSVIARYATTNFGMGWVENVSDSAEIDREVSTIQFVNAKQKNIATLTNFGCHPTVLNGTNTLISSDFPAGLYKQLKTKLGGVNLYLQGAIGGWVQPENVTPSFEEAEKKGIALADAVISALKASTPLEGTQISFRSKSFEIPIKNKNFVQLADAGIIKRDIGEGTLTEIAVFSIGNAMFATHPGETSPLYGFQTKKLMNNKGPKFILGLGMDELGYIIKPEFFLPGTSLHAATYLTGMSPGKETADAMMEVLSSLAE